MVSHGTRHTHPGVRGFPLAGIVLGALEAAPARPLARAPAPHPGGTTSRTPGRGPVGPDPSPGPSPGLDPDPDLLGTTGGDGEQRCCTGWS